MHIVRTLVLASLAATAACASSGAPTPAGTTAGADKPLFDRLGGLDAIKAVVGEFLTNVAADDKIKARFANANLEGLRAKLVDQICQATGGPCNYTGLDMKSAHAGMKVTEDEFNALVGDLVKALDKFKVPEKEKGELLGALGAMKPDIIGGEGGQAPVSQFSPVGLGPPRQSRVNSTRPFPCR